MFTVIQLILLKLESQPGKQSSTVVNLILQITISFHIVRSHAHNIYVTKLHFRSTTEISKKKKEIIN